MKITISNQIKKLWFEGKLLEEYFGSICTKQSSRFLQTEIWSSIIHLYYQVLSYQVHSITVALRHSNVKERVNIKSLSLSTTTEPYGDFTPH